MFRRSFNLPALLAVVTLLVSPVLQAMPVVRTVAPAKVVAVQAARAADLVVLGDGFAAGLRQGMVCRVTRGGAEIGDILLVDLRSGAATALILNLAPGQRIQPGDTAAVRTRQV
ncbi:MAG: hypothetical protein ABII82_17980 [Verrucomicrobiota bacterium]